MGSHRLYVGKGYILSWVVNFCAGTMTSFVGQQALKVQHIFRD